MLLPPIWRWPIDPLKAPRPNELEPIGVMAATGLSFVRLGESMQDKELSGAVNEAGLGSLISLVMRMRSCYLRSLSGT